MQRNAFSHGMKRAESICLALCVMLGVTAVNAALKSPETTPPTDFREGYTASIVPKAPNSTVIYENAKLSKVVGVKGDFFFLHTNYMLPYLAECEWSNIDGVETNDGLYWYHYGKSDTEEYALCQFQGKFRGSYLFVLTLKLIQDGDAIKASVVGTSYPWNSPFGSNQESTSFGVTYFENLDDITGSSGGMTRASLSNVSLIFTAGGATINVKFADMDGNILSEQEVEYGDSAVPPDATLVPEISGYVFAGWDGDYSAIQKDVVFKPVYHKLCKVNFVDGAGQPVCEEQTVEETKSATPPDMTGRSFDGAPFYAWDGDASVIMDDTTFTAIYKRIPVWTTGTYDLSTWTATNNILANATIANVGLTYHSENNRTDNKPENLTNGAVPPNKTTYDRIVGIQRGSIEWTLDEPYYIDSISFYTSWGDGARDGIAIDQILYKVEGSDEWIEAAGPIDGNTVSYGVGNNSTSGSLFATLSNADGVPFAEKATALKIVFPNAQDNSGSGYAEIEVTGKNQAEIDGGAWVTFVDFDGSVLQSGFVEFGAAAVPPEDPVRDGYKFVGWDGDYSHVVRPVTVTALYHKWCSVVFKDADGTQIGDTQIVEETYAAEPPDMTDATYGGKAFLSWDGDPRVISDDIVFNAVYGSIPSYVRPFIAAHGDQLPSNALIWAGDAQGEWNATDISWVRADEVPTAWQPGSAAVFPVPATITLNGEQTVSEFLVYGSVVLQGDDVTLAAPAKITHFTGGPLRFSCNVKGVDGIELDYVRECNYLPYGEENAVLVFSDTSLSDIDTSVLRVMLRYSRSGAEARSATAGIIADGVGKTGISYFKSGDGWLSFECRIILVDWYNNPYIAKVVLRQVGSDIYGYVERAEALENISNSSSIEVTGGAHRQITVATSEPISGTGAPSHQLAVEDIILADRDALWNSATEFSGDYQATGPIAVKAGIFKVVDEGTVFGGHCDGGVGQTSPILISDNGTFMFDSVAEQFFATSINGTSSGNGYMDTHKDASLNGRFVIGPNARTVTFNCTSEGMHRFYGPVDVYGTVTISKGTYHIFYNNDYGIFVRDGGILNMNSFLNNYGLRDALVTCYRGGTINFTDVWSTGSGGTSRPLTLDGGVAHMTKDYTGNLGADIKQSGLVLMNGAIVDGVMMTWGRGDEKITVDGTVASTIALEKIRFGTNKSADSNKMLETIVVNDVTGDDEADLTVSSELYLNGSLTWSLAKATNLGIVKDGAGTLLMTGVSTNFGGSVTMKSGTLAFGSSAVLNGAALVVTGESALNVAYGATVAFADSSAMAWTAGKTLDIQGELFRHSLRVGTDENGLTPEQLAQITYHGKPGRITIDGEGYVHGPAKGTYLLFR